MKSSSLALAALLCLSACSHATPVHDPALAERVSKLEAKVQRLQIQTDPAEHNSTIARLESHGQHKKAQKAEKKWEQQ